MSHDILDYFEKAIRPRAEAVGPLPDLRIDSLLGFSDSEFDRGSITTALRQSYPLGHWALETSQFQHVLEKAMQLLSAGLCNLASKSGERDNPLECCVRIINAPTLSPYIQKSKYNYIVIPTGFVSTLEKFISSTFAVAAVSAGQQDAEKKTAIWGSELLLGSIARLAFSDIFTFTRGVMEASVESSIQQILDTFSDPIAFAAFDRKIQAEMLQSMPAASSWERFGLNHLDDALNKHPETKVLATRIARLSVCFTICHEFGHAFALSINEDGADELAKNEAFADMMGTLIVYRLIEAGIIQKVVGADVNPMDLGHAVAAFHSWSLSKELGALLNDFKGLELERALDRLHEVADRWKQAMKLIQKVWIDQVSVLTDPVTTGFMIINQWSIMTAGMLRVALLKRGRLIDIEMAGEALELLANRNSTIYNYLSA